MVYMQLTSGSYAVGSRRIILHFDCLFERKIKKKNACAFEGGG